MVAIWWWYLRWASVYSMCSCYYECKSSLFQTIQGIIQLSAKSKIRTLKSKEIQLCNFNWIYFYTQQRIFWKIQIGPTKMAPLLIKPIEIRVLWTEIKYTKSAARLLNRVWVNKRGLDLSKDVLWVSVGQLAAKLQAVKVGGWSYRPGIEPGPHARSARWAARQDFFQISNFDSL